jgi:rhodanese-related sulfurtransferase
MACIFAGAVLLGAIYNEVSPLGVRMSQPAGLEGDKAAATGTAQQARAARAGYVNEVLSMSLEDSVGTPPPLPPGPVVQPAGPGVRTVTWAQVKPLLDGGRIVLVDARSESNYAFGHIPGAVSLPGSSSLPEVQAFAAKYPKTTVIVTYCSSDMCSVSRELAETLMKTGGFSDVSYMPGGYTEYLVARPPAKT